MLSFGYFLLVLFFRFCSVVGDFCEHLSPRFREDPGKEVGTLSWHFSGQPLVDEWLLVLRD